METQKNTNKYTKGKIYKIVCDTTGLLYIGSTIQGLSSRISGHRADYKRFLDKKSTKYTTSYQILENNNYKIILIEKFPCNSKEELHSEERKYIDLIDCVNKKIPTRTKQEYSKIYKEENKELIKIKNKEYRKNNKEHIKITDKQYKENNKERIKIRDKEYREKNKEIIEAKQSVKVICDNCGCSVRKDYISKHKKMDKCINFKKNII